MNPETAAAILNVPVDAPRGDIIRAFTLRARMTHPDRFAGAPQRDVEAATAEFIRVSDARDALLAKAAERERAVEDARRAAEHERQKQKQQKEQKQQQQQTRHASAGSGSRENSPHETPLMSFEQFAAWREAAAWQQFRPPETPQPGTAASAPQPSASSGQNATAPTSAGRIPERANTPPPAKYSLKGTWWALGGGAALVVGALTLAIVVSSSGQSGSTNEKAFASDGPVVKMDAGDGATVDVDTSPNGWTWLLTSDTDCPNARITVSFRDADSGDPVGTYSDTAPLESGVPYSYTVPDGTHSGAYASLDDVVCQ